MSLFEGALLYFLILIVAVILLTPFFAANDPENKDE